jgi:hypothetical protein
MCTVIFIDCIFYVILFTDNMSICMLEFQWTVLNHGVSADTMNAPESNSISALFSSLLVLVQYLIHHHACCYFSNSHIFSVCSFFNP